MAHNEKGSIYVLIQTILAKYSNDLYVYVAGDITELMGGNSY